MRRTPRAIGPVAAVVAIVLGLPVRAVSVESWSASTAERLSRGTLDGTALDADGRVRLAPEIETLWGPERGIVWAVAPAGPRAAFVALSGPGRVLRVEAGRPAEVWFEAPEEALITAAASDGEGGVIFGVSPDGRVLRARRSGAAPVEVETLLDTAGKFVWALARGADGTLWIGSGIPGALERLSPSGERRSVLEVADDPVRSLVATRDGGVVIGTGARGRVSRVDAAGRAFVLLDADEAEISSVAVASDGTIFALAAQKLKQPSPTRAAAEADASGELGAVRVSVTAPAEPAPEDEREPAAAPVRPPTRPAVVGQPGGALYRIDPDGAVRRIWTTTEELPFALLVTDSDRVLVATGDAGRVHEVDRDGRAALLLRVSSDQASALASGERGAVLVGATTDARVEILGARPRREGAYLSPAIDAGAVADWGRLSWQVERPRGGDLRVAARSGNTAEPDDSWSPWVELEHADGGVGTPTRVPPARWFQARFAMVARDGESPRLGRIDVAYQLRNRAPVVSALSIEPTGVAWMRGPAQSGMQSGPVAADDPVARRVAAGLQAGRGVGANIRRLYEAGVRTFSWRAEDPDRDRLRYRLELRRESEETWFLLADGIEEEFYGWDARSVPDGVYRARLTVDDAADNPNGTHRTAERIGDTFRIDNTRPTVEPPEIRRQAGSWEVRFVARDTAGALTAVEVAIDGGGWTPLSPEDGVADSALERYRLLLDPPAPGRTGERTLLVRAVDTEGNVGGAMWKVGP